MILRQAQTFAFLFSPWRALPAARHPYRASGLVLAQIAVTHGPRGERVKSGPKAEVDLSTGIAAGASRTELAIVK
jgi:hypothetical protein